MQNDTVEHEKLTQQQLADLVIETEAGARSPTNPLVSKGMIILAFVWSVFQLIVASPMSTVLNLNGNEIRYIHLAFALVLCFLAYPATSKSPRSYVPFQDWIFALVSSGCALYLFVFSVELSGRPGAPIDMDIYVGCAGIVLLLEAARRALGLPLVIIATVFITYTLFGSADFVPDVIRHKGQSLNKTVSHQWLTTEGVFGIAIGVSSGFVFMFVLFGSLLESAGAGNYFIRTAFAGLGHMRGGPAKAAVVSSGMTGLVSGSSIANVVTTGTFTIPLMKKVGFSAEKAGAVEVAASTNGQLTPPVMGAAAFLMVEYVGISYVEVIKHAFLPAIISYIALVYIVHLEACKMGLKGMDRPITKTLAQKLLSFVMTILFIIIIGGATYFGLGWIKTVAGSATIYVVTLLLAVAYLGLIWLACRVPELEVTHEITELPDLGSTAQAGYYFLLPIVVLMWCLTVERLSPSLSAYWATILLLFIVLTQRPLKGFFRKSKAPEFSFKLGWENFVEGMVSGGRNMIGIGVATAAAGIVVGTVTLTGIGLVMTEFVEFISGGNLMLILFFTAGISLLLGMGLPTTANYIVVSTLMAPVIVELGAQNGLIVPLIAVHLFVFYFGILADDTPPVGLAAFAAAGISGGDPIRTGIQGFTYDIRTAILPFIFIFNTELLMIGIGGWLHLTIIVFGAVVAMMIFAAATQGWFLTKNRWWETAALLLIAFTLFRPGYFWDKIYPPLTEKSPTELVQVLDEIESGSQLRLRLKGEKMSGDEFEMTVMLSVGNESNGAEKLSALGIETRDEEGKVIVDMVGFGSPAEKAKIDFDQEILSVQMPTERPNKELMFFPALLLLAVIWFIQRGRARKIAASATI